MIGLIALALLIVALVVFTIAAIGIVAASAKVICVGLAFAAGAWVIERLAVYRRDLP